MTPPSRLGVYPIERELGRGGMGIVYQGRDPRLGRTVAIKVLSDAVAQDPERLARFDREARLLASLNHPNIAGIYGVEEADGVKFLVLEYVDGETLAERLARERLSIPEGLEICRQIAAAVESAHENGIIHRDLKPGNVKITPAGDVKVLDFGLAKGKTSSDSAFDPELTHSPTRVLTGTGEGVILGTAAYMSPEQARGKPLDRRTDIWSFGCVLFECLTGRRPFEGETATDLIAIILQGSPEWSDLPARTPVSIRRLLERCLEKDSKRRLRDIGDARLEIEHAIAAKDVEPDVVSKSGHGTRWASLLAALFAVSTAVVAWLHFGSTAPRPGVMRLSVISPLRIGDGDAVRAALSPDGTQLVFTGDDSSGRGLWLRSLDDHSLKRLTGYEDAVTPFWSPDGKHVGFFTERKLKTVDVESGLVEELCSASFGRGAAWNKQGVILFAAAGEGPLVRIPAKGGPIEHVTVLDSTLHETAHRYPCFLPDGRHFLYVALPPRGGAFNVFLGDLESKDKTLLLTAQGAPIYVASGHLLYVRNGRLAAQRFDATRRKLEGDAVNLGDTPGFSEWTGSPCFSASQTGSICILTPPSNQRRLVWYDRSGHPIQTVPIPEANYQQVMLSPDDRKAALVKRESPFETDLWIVELERGISSRFTFGMGEVEQPVWSPDGARIAFASNREGTYDIYVKAVNGASPETLLYRSKSQFKSPEDWSPDGMYLLFRELNEKTAYDLWVLPLDGRSEPFPYLVTPFDERDAMFSPDGKWVAYWSNESGKSDVFVRSFPNPDQKVLISSARGVAPIWSADGRHILYTPDVSLLPRRIAGGLSAVIDVFPGDPFRVGTPVEAFRIKEPLLNGDAARGLDRVLALIESGKYAQDSFSIVLNWPSALPQR